MFSSLLRSRRGRSNDRNHSQSPLPENADRSRIRIHAKSIDDDDDDDDLDDLEQSLTFVRKPMPSYFGPRHDRPSHVGGQDEDELEQDLDISRGKTRRVSWRSGRGQLVKISATDNWLLRSRPRSPVRLATVQVGSH